MRIPDEQIQRVRDLTDIVPLVEESVSLKRTGRNLKGLCPFHQERTASFTVSPDKGIFHCFGCQRGGDVFAFVMESQGTDFPDAVRYLAERAGVRLEASEESGEIEALYRLHAFAAGFFQEVLYRSPDGAAARRYVESRGIPPAQVRAFGLGAAPDAWSVLGDRARRAGFSSEVLRASGLVLDRRDSSQYYDRFRARLIFPIRAATGRVVAFGGRILSGDGPKYINSPESRIYKKGSLLFGLDAAREKIRKSGQVVVVEGYTDCIALHRAGFSQSVAALGTAFTAQQAGLLARYAGEVILLFDADAAGQAASLKGMGSLFDAGLSVRVAALPMGEDPDSMVATGRTEELGSAVENARDAIAFQLDLLQAELDEASPVIRARKVAPVIDLVEKLSDRTAREGYFGIVADRIQVDVSALRRGGRSGRASSGAQEPSTVSGAERGFDPADYELMRLIMTNECERVFEAIPAAWIADERVRSAYEGLMREYAETGAIDVGALMRSTEDEGLRRFLGRAAADPEPLIESERLVGDLKMRLGKVAGAQERWQIRRQLAQETDPEARLELLGQLNDLILRSRGTH